ncbi:acyltransferase domain-containing protein [Streptomyces actuosus]|uniref:Acyltransferase domain-containing protein n=1 Tax=Streptomyces actuosus TaxID=1885 RepID=A0ABS2VVS6_STRAS|nr:type I polyketide synthase [Streptomyces actuosus]MBN0047120.1 acyltransferase domain-containing protein [Streptomyces actuosus]
MTHDTQEDQDHLVAVVGMAGRFPGAPDVERFWENLLAARETVTVLPDRADPAHPDFVPAYGVLEDAGDFDAAYFGLSAHDALITDPQQRLLLECAHEALERAGHGGVDRPVTGVYVGAGGNGYAEAVRARSDEMPFLDEWRLRQATAPDFAATRIAYHLDLTGPAMTVQTACSTSLVAVHLAVQALLNGECDLALAGGATVAPHVPAMRYTPGGIVAADGHCRAFDADSDGTVAASAVGVVVLRPLADALADGDHVHAVIRGSAVNNDGRHKAGFTAPSVVGQAEVVRTAHEVAGIDPREVGYVEAHGTGTALGDPIEVAALTRAFGSGEGRQAPCLIGSVKTNIGHADAAAGVTGFIKTVLSVEHGVVPATLHYRRPNPAVDFTTSSFEVSGTTRAWPTDGHRIAGVNAVGVGGTNAHVVLEQAPHREESAPSTRHRLLLVSGRTPAAAEAAADCLADHLAAHPGTHLGDAAWTLQDGRTHHAHRRFVVASGTQDAVSALRGRATTCVAGALSDAELVFMYPGQGGQHVGMAAGLYDGEPAFRRSLDELADAVTGSLGVDLRDVLYPRTDAERAGAAERLATMEVGQPAVFAVQYATTRLLDSWGLRPTAVTGHSLGAYAAACAAGVFAPADAARLVAERGRLLGTVPAGAMAAVRLPEEEVLGLLPADLTVGAVNGPGQCTVTGPAASVARFVQVLTDRGSEARVLRIATAGHSPLVDPVTRVFAEAVEALPRERPTLPVLSDTTGAWADQEAVRTSRYWVRHMREPVRFGEALDTLFGDPDRVLVDVGPGRTLATLTRQHAAYDSKQAVVRLAPHPAEEASETAVLLAGVGEMWARGAHPDFAALQGDGPRRRIALPTYPFERRRHLVPPPVPATPAAAAPAPSAAASATTAEPASALPTEAAAPPGVPAPEGPPVLQAVLTAFGQALGYPDIDPRDGLFDLGGDSLTATKLAAWAGSTFRVTVKASDVLRFQTPSAFAALIEERRAGAPTQAKENPAS